MSAMRRIGREAGATTVIAVAMLLLALCAAALTGGAAHATTKGPNGPIVYQATAGKHIQLFTRPSSYAGTRSNAASAAAFCAAGRGAPTRRTKAPKPQLGVCTSRKRPRSLAPTPNACGTPGGI